MDSIDFSNLNNPQPEDDNQQNQQQKPAYTQESYTTDGKPVTTDVYPPDHKGNLGVSFSKLIGSNVTVPMTNALVNLNTEKSSPIKKKKKKSTDVATTDNATPASTSREIVESTVYADTYADTNNMTYSVINQADR